MSRNGIREFDSLTEAFTHVVGKHVLGPVGSLWDRSASGLVYPRDAPECIFRGECGEFETTFHGLARLRLEVEAGDGRLSVEDLIELAKIVDWIARKLCERLDETDWRRAFVLLQHYGLPTRFVDFTADPSVAFAFAACGESSIGRIAVMPCQSSEEAEVLGMFDHPWAERAQRQAAYCVRTTTGELADLKSKAAKSRLGIEWYQFPILPSDREFFRPRYQELIKESNDPSAGFVRFYLTLYVETFGKAFASVDGMATGPRSGRALLRSGQRI
jgi:FRG domain